LISNCISLLASLDQYKTNNYVKAKLNNVNTTPKIDDVINQNDKNIKFLLNEDSSNDENIKI